MKEACLCQKAYLATGSRLELDLKLVHVRITSQAAFGEQPPVEGDVRLQTASRLNANVHRARATLIPQALPASASDSLS